MAGGRRRTSLPLPTFPKVPMPSSPARPHARKAGPSEAKLLPHHPSIPTSRDNARRLQTKRARYRAAILRCLRQMGAYGATRAELSFNLGIPIQSVCPLVVWLRDDTKELEQTDRRRDGGYVLVAAQVAGGSHE